MTKLPLPAALLLALAVPCAHAAELGEATVRSYSGQQLVADIELADLTAQDLADLQVRLASRDVFQGANVTMNPALAGMTIAVVKRDQRRTLHLTTSVPVQAEVLHLYFALANGARESVRGVTLWLAPAPPAPAPVPAPVRAPVPVPLPVPAAQPTRVVAAPALPEPAPQPPVRAAGTRPATPELPVERKKVASTQPAGTPEAGAPVQAPPRRDPAAAMPVHAVEPSAVRPAAPARQVEHPPVKSVADADRPAATLARHVPAPVRPVAAATRPTAIAPGSADIPAKPAAAPARPVTDPAMLKKLAELEAKLKSLQAVLAHGTMPGHAQELPVAPGKPTAHAAASAAVVTASQLPERTPSDKGERRHTPADAMPEAQPAVPRPKVTLPPASESQHATPEPKVTPPGPESQHAAPKAKITPPAPAARKAPAPAPEPVKEKKMSRPKVLTMIAGAVMALLLVAGIVVHVVRRRKASQASAQIKVWQSWRKKAIAEAATAGEGEVEAEAAAA